MNITIRMVCFVAAAICFFLKGAGVSAGQIDLTNIGFGLVTVGMIV